MIRLLFIVFKRLSHVHGAAFFRLGVLTLVILAYSSSGFMYFELAGRPDLTWGDSIWWSMVTVTTVGYGDLFPQTVGGRYLVGFPTMLFGISILGYLLSTVATYLIEARAKEVRGMGEVISDNHILVIHFPSLNRVGAVIEELRNDPKSRRTPIVLLDEQLEELPQALKMQSVQFIRGNPSKVAVLERANYETASHAIILAKNPMDPTSDNHTLAAVLTLEQLRPEIISVAECIDPEQIDLLYRAGCDSVLCINKLSTNLLVQEALDPGVQGVLGEITSHTVGQQMYIVEIEELRTWRYSDVVTHLQAQGVLPMGLARGKHVELNPTGDDPVEFGDRVVCIALHRPDPIRIS